MTGIAYRGSRSPVSRRRRCLRGRWRAAAVAAAERRTASGSAADVARKLGRTPHFLVGMGNDLAKISHGWRPLGLTLDLHYAYLVGLPRQGGWPDWNAGGPS